MSLFAMRRKRQEISGKVGEAPPPHLVPSAAAVSGQHAPALPHPDFSGQPAMHVSSPANYYVAPQQSTEAQIFAPAGAAPMPMTFQLPPPSLFNIFPSTTLDPTTSGGVHYSAGPPPQRDVRSAGYVSPYSPQYQPPAAATGTGAESPPKSLGAPLPTSSDSHQPAAAVAMPPPLEIPSYGRRARTSELDTRDFAKQQRQREYQAEIAKQAEEARERKRLERERQRQEDEAMERRALQERQRLGEQEQREREKEIQDRAQKEESTLGGKRRGGNRPPPSQDMTEIQRQLQEQIEEKRRRKEEDDAKKLRDDEAYERKHRASLAGGSALPPLHTGASAAAAAPLPWEVGPPGAPTNFPAGDAVGQSHPWGVGAGAASSSAAAPPLKDSLFSMLVDGPAMRTVQEQQSYFPLQPQASSVPHTTYALPPSYHPLSGGAAAPMPQRGAGPLYGGGGGDLGFGSGWGSAPVASAVPGSSTPFYALPGGRAQAAPDPAAILRRFMEDDAARGAYGMLASPNYYTPSGDDISLELPSSEPPKFLGRRDEPRQRRW